GELARRIRKAANWKSLRPDLSRDMLKVYDEAKKQGVNPDKIGRGIVSEIQQAFGADAPEMLDYYFGKSKVESKGLVAGSALEKWADDVLKGGGVHGGVDVLAAYIVKGVAVIERGVTDFAKWSAEMVKEYGADVK